MLPSQRALFDVPREICYLNAASWSPIPLAVQQAGRDGATRKGRPWLLDAGFAARQHERARTAAARLINADPGDVALISSVSYGVATAAKALALPPGTRVLVLEDDHASPVLEWTSRAPTGGFTVEAIKRPGNGDWTEAVLTAIARPGAAPVALASISSVHWSDGGVVDLGRGAGAARKRRGLAARRHAIGRRPAARRRRHRSGFRRVPDLQMAARTLRPRLPLRRPAPSGMHALLEQTAGGRRAVRAEQTTYMADTAYVDDARRFDMGERDHLVSLEMAAVGIEMMAAWGAGAVAQRLAMLTERLAAGLVDLDVGISEPRVRSPHILTLDLRMECRRG